MLVPTTKGVSSTFFGPSRSKVKVTIAERSKIDSIAITQERLDGFGYKFGYRCPWAWASALLIGDLIVTQLIFLEFFEKCVFYEIAF